MSDLVKVNAKEDKIRIAPEVIETIAGMAASEVEHVMSMSGSLADGIAGFLGRKNLGKGVKVEVAEKDVTIEISIVVIYGCKIHEVARLIQERVREVVESMTGLCVKEVNVSIVGVDFPKSVRKEELALEVPEEK